MSDSAGFESAVRRRSRKLGVSKSAGSESTDETVFLKAKPLRSFSDVEDIKHEVESGNILIVKVSPLAHKNVEEIKKAVNALCEFVKTVDGDIARLGEERIVVTPSGVRIWREKPVSPQGEVATAA